MSELVSDLLKSQLQRWGEELVDLRKGNRLVYFKHLKSGSLEFTQPGTDIIAGFSRRGGSAGWGFHLPVGDGVAPGAAGVGPAIDELVVIAEQSKDAAQIQRGVSTLAKKVQAEYLETGLWVLYLGIGFLNWRSEDVDIRSPLYLLPVKLEQRGANKAWRLTLADEGDAALNPSLAVKLETDHGIVLPPLDDVSPDAYPSVIAAVRNAVAGQSWTVDDRVVLSTFTFQKEVIYRDLQANAAQIAGHPLVKLLAEGPTSTAAQDLAFEPEPEETLDLLHPPEDLACILDADATQRRCIIAARDGRSFVMDGPPGTGKSQTIANVIAQLLKDGRTVLFVSEKAAALDVVYDRLAAVGLDPFVLALHSNKTTRKAVAETLGAALQLVPAARSRFTAEDRVRIEQLRQELSGFSRAVNEERQPLGRSLHDVVGRISELDGAPVVGLPQVDLTTLDPTALVAIMDQAERLGRTWAPVVERDDTFLWKGLRASSGSANSVVDHRARIGAHRNALTRLRELIIGTYAEAGLAAGSVAPTVIGHLAELLQLVDERSAVGEAWLVIADGTDYDEWVNRATASADEVDRKAAALAARAPQWTSIEPGIAKRLEAIAARVAELRPAAGPLAYRTSTDLYALAEALERTSQGLNAALGQVQGLVGGFGVSAGPVNLELARRLAELGVLAGSSPVVETSWFDGMVLQQAQGLSRAWQEQLAAYHAFETSLTRHFKPEVLSLDLDGLHRRLATEHGAFGKLGKTYRADKATLAAATRSGKATADEIGQLDQLVAWQRCAAEVRNLEERARPLLGPRYLQPAQPPDFARLDGALATADRAIALAGSTVHPATLAHVFTLAEAQREQFRAAGEAVLTALADNDRPPLSEWLSAARSDIDQLPIDQAVTWHATVARDLRGLAGEVAVIEAAADRPLATNDAFEIAKERDEHHLAWSQLVAGLSQGRHIVGSVADRPTGPALRAAQAWVHKARERLGGPLPEQLARWMLTTTRSGAELTRLRAEVDEAREQLLALFEPDRAAQLSTRMNQSLDDALVLLGELDESAGDVHDWWDHAGAVTELERHGLGAVVEVCRREKVPAGSVAAAVELAVLRRWAEQVSANDARLQQYRSVDRDKIRAEYQRLDRLMVQNAAADVINACASRVPRSTLGGAGLILQQSQLKRKHLPVRTLLGQAAEAVQRLKPCFMMSPLTVSQFVPPGMTFDVVIFDEASQVREADAICCVYRGRQLIMAGDQKQLPPTDFFDRTADVDELDQDDDDPLEFESVLDRCKAQGFVPLPLSWHYRSQHQDLITYSNHSFYDGNLLTFPSAQFDAPDLGVGFYKVDGVYRRGGRGDNQVEASAVIDRVVFHRRHHPDATLGVIALSSKQQEAIEAEIQRRTPLEPELRELRTDDRLTGFFVKNLENVQGDERDIIILSIGYGRDEAGKLTMNFGPLNRETGWRRLNVAVTRAKRRIELVASITAGDINSDTPSIRHLARYLDFAERGHAALAIDVGGSLGGADSPFEDEVTRSIRAMGYDPVPQVGVAGYRIDVGIRHPTKPGNYLLGVECDGAAYHSSRVARDRDRLRQQVLEGLGWTIHRIWSTAWFADRAAEEARLRAAVESALATPAPTYAAPASRQPVDVTVDEVASLALAFTTQPDAAADPPDEVAEQAPVVEFTQRDLGSRPSWAKVYREPFAPVRRVDGVEFIEFHARPVIAQQALGVITDFGPLHYDGVLRAVRSSWGVERAGRRIREQFDACLDRLVRDGSIVRNDPWLSVPGQEVHVRVPLDRDHARRAVTEVPPAEITLGIVQLLTDAGSASFEELRSEWAGLYGWRSMTSDVVTVFAAAVKNLLDAGVLAGPNPLRVVRSTE